MEKLMMIINPAAGRGGYKQGLPEALKLLSDAGCTVSLFFTQRALINDRVVGHTPQLLRICRKMLDAGGNSV